jgi:hypothetical protein
MGFLRNRFGKDATHGRNGDRDVPPRLIVRTRCVLVADVVAIDAEGKHELVAAGLEEAAARDVYMEITGRPWTRAETGH